MRDFDTYAARERLESYRANAARKLTRQQRAQRRRLYRRTSAVFLVILLCICSALCGVVAAQAVWRPIEQRSDATMKTHPWRNKTVSPAPAMEQPEDFENERIEEALLSRSSVIDDCTVTFYCAEKYPHICGTGDGIARDGTPVIPWATCAVDPSIIPLGSTVMVDLGDRELLTLVANDTGVQGDHIDICVPTHAEAMRLGIQTSTVYWCEEG